MLNVTHLITDLSTGGAQMMLYKLLSGMDTTLFRTEVITLTDAGPISDRIQALGVPVRALGMARGKPTPSSVLKLAQLVRESRPDVLQTWMYHADLMGSLAARLAGNPPVIWGLRQSNLSPTVNKRSTLLTAKLCARLSKRLPKRIVCASESARSAHVDYGYAAQPMVVIPNGFDLSAFRPDPFARSSVRDELGVPAETLLIGMVGRFDPQKDYANFVAAAAHLHAELPEVHYLLCGTGLSWDNEELIGWIHSAGIKDRMHLLGRREDVPRLTAALDIATISSCGEAFPNVVGEAMACGIPCAVTDVGDAALIVGETGRVALPQNARALAEAWKSLLDAGPQERHRLGTLARERVERQFSLPLIVKQYESLYKDVLAICAG